MVIIKLAWASWHQLLQPYCGILLLQNGKILYTIESWLFVRILKFEYQIPSLVQIEGYRVRLGIKPSSQWSSYGVTFMCWASALVVEVVVVVVELKLKLLEGIQEIIKMMVLPSLTIIGKKWAHSCILWVWPDTRTIITHRQEQHSLKNIPFPSWEYTTVH